MNLSKLAVLFLALLSGPASAEVLTVHQLKQHWQQYDGKRVRIRGQLNACGPAWFCAICPEEMTRDKYDWRSCVPFAFENQHVSDFNSVADEVDQLLRIGYRFATVTVEADFSSSCLSDEQGRSIGDVVCGDGPANLDNAQILGVNNRRTASEGSVDKEDVRELLPPETKQEASAIATEFGAVVSWGEPKVFLVKLTPNDVHNLQVSDEGIVEGLGCICLVDRCDGKWPITYFPFMNSPANPWRCWAMQKKANGWRVLPNF